MNFLAIPKHIKSMVFSLLLMYAIFASIHLINLNEDQDTVFSLIPSLNDKIPNNGQITPLFDIQPFQTPHILFIVDNAKSLNVDKDLPFLNYMNSTLNYEVTCHDSNNSYEYDGFDAIVISNSVSESDTVDSLINASIPIMTMQAGHYDEFKLGIQFSVKSSTEIFILNTNHFVTQGLKNDTYLRIYSTAQNIHHIKGYGLIPIGVEIEQHAARVDKENIFLSDATWLTLDKGKHAWDLTLAPERRAFWGGFWGTELHQDGWNYWTRTLNWLLYDDVPGFATIQVDVTDLDNNSIQYANVTLTDSWNQSQSWSRNTSSSGSTIFTDIPFGYYNITVTYKSSLNNDLQYLEIAGERTYHIKPNFYFSVQMEVYIDNDPPIITNIQFHPSNSTFSAEIYDVSNVHIVNLNLTVKDSSNGSILRNNVYLMVTLNGNLFFNDTALVGLPLIGISVCYNITAVDVAGNREASENQFFTLGDISAPVVHEYNVTDNEDGTLEFYANITDVESLVQSVILRINETFQNMYLNSSGFWIFETTGYYGLVLNYSIFSATDSVGNVNNDSIFPEFGLITPQDSFKPLIYDVRDTFTTHVEGFVIFIASVEELNEYQSGVNTSSVSIIISIFNGTWFNNSLYQMTALGEITYEFEWTFNYNDTVVYRIIATDLAGNLNDGYEHINTIDDNAMPQLTFTAQEFGNGTVEFNSTVIDWPINATDVTLFYTQDYFGDWLNVSMINITNNLYTSQIQGFDFRLHDVWYYTTAIDLALNLYTPTPDQYQKVDLSDLIAPQIFFIIENSTTVDGETFITAWANDPFGDTLNINNTFYINFTKQGVTSQYEMNYDWFYFYSFDHIFNYNDEITIEISTNDSVGNIGKTSRTITIGDYSAPKILNTGIIEYQNGTVTFWAEVIEYSTGSGLPNETSSIRLEYVFISSYNVSMIWNGSEDFYTYTVSGFVPGNAFTYRISAFDNCNNSVITFWVKANIEDNSPPIINEFGYEEILMNHTSVRLNFWVDAMDVFGPVIGTEIVIDYFDDGLWNSINGEMTYIGNIYSYFLILPCNTTFNYSIQVFDAKPNIILLNDSNLRTYWGPVIIDAGVVQQLDNSLLIWANVSDWGSGVTEVTLEYEFEPQGGSGSEVLRSNVKTVNLEFNGTLYITILSFSETGAFSWTISAKDDVHSFISTKSSFEPFFVSLPSPSLNWEVILPLIITVAITPLVIAFAIVSVRRRHSRSIEKKKHIERVITQRFSEILSIRSIICRNNNGLAFYTKTFMEEGQDLDLAAGLTSAVSALVSEVSRRAIKKGEFDLIEREDFSILSHRGEYSTISVVSEGKLGSYSRERITDLHNTLESHFTQENLEDPMFGDHNEYVQGLVYKYLNLSILSKLTIDFNRFKAHEKKFSKDERKFINYLGEIPPLRDGLITFYVPTFTSSITRHGVSMAKAYSLLEKCFELRIVYPIAL
ncbi:MAG: carboxypeptidase-like regulatory domain-containing protein [Promethearchaeota archaeon]